MLDGLNIGRGKNTCNCAIAEDSHIQPIPNIIIIQLPFVIRSADLVQGRVRVILV